MSDDLVWRKASYSSGQGGNCVEVAEIPGRSVAVRDSKNPNGPVIRLSASEWEELLRTFLDLAHSEPR